jgi:thiosulfate dehydrogenase
LWRPDAANTRPETYPKFQVQLRRVAPPRDMINWRIGRERLDPDDPKRRAIEAYIMSQRKGLPTQFGKR